MATDSDLRAALDVALAFGLSSVRVAKRLAATPGGLDGDPEISLLVGEMEQAGDELTALVDRLRPPRRPRLTLVGRGEA